MEKIHMNNKKQKKGKEEMQPLNCTSMGGSHVIFISRCTLESLLRSLP